MKNKSSSTSNFKEVSVTVLVDSEANALLSKSCEVSSRTKRREASLRLKDHLIRFSTISRINLVEE